ncbi:MAG: Npt1/Npt2 family nucleotide transporter [Chlamydiota bacterium]|jgi:AAA family ATP:ADP antiporter
MFKRFTAIKGEFSKFTSKEKIFIFCMMALGFLISLEYSITRPASNGIFITNLSTRLFPLVWLCTVPVNLFFIHTYNRFLSKLGCLKMFLAFTFSIISLNFLTGLLVVKVPYLIFIQFILKDIYILFMFKQMWSLIHATIPKERAKYIYGIIFGMGGIGSIFGSTIPSFLSVGLGAEKLFFFSAPIYLLAAFFYWKAYLKSSFQHEPALTDKPFKNISTKELFQSVKNSKYLVGILSLVIFMQLAISLTDYQFNQYLELNISGKDLRTQYCGRLFGLTNIITSCFQFFGGYMLIHLIGLKRNHLLVPMLLLLNTVTFFLFPTFAMISFSLVAIKSVDHSLFGISREMLYVPLSTDEKFKAKAVIDIFAYRTARSFASFFIFILQGMAFAKIMPIVNIGLIVIFIAWLFTVVKLFKQKQAESIV